MFSGHKLLRFAILPFLALTSTGLARAPQTQLTQPASKESKDEKRAAKLLYEDAKSYVDKAFAEFNKQKIAYDQKLEAKTRQEQKDLAAKYVAVLQARKSLNDADAYYLGMLQYLADNPGGALEAMRRFLGGKAAGENAQLARAVVVLYATRQNLIPEAEQAVAAYAQDEPRNLPEWFGMESLITAALNNGKDYAGMLKHAEEMQKIAKLVAAERVGLFPYSDATDRDSVEAHCS